jgi:membrane fusion protein (multidrug efflux system)
MKLVNVGDQVLSQVGNMNPVFEIYDIKNVKIYADVPEKYYSFVKKGISAQITCDALPGKVFNGTVNNVRPVIDPLTRTTQVEIIIPNYSGEIKPGMFAKVDLVLQKNSGAMMIPFDAVLGDGDKYVFVADNNIAKKKTVTLGIQSVNEVEILSGLMPSDKVITVGQRIVSENSTIEVQ